MSTNFILVDCDTRFPRDGSSRAPQAKHYMQQTGFTCGAASISMILGLPEAECRKLAHTTRTGTGLFDAADAFKKAGRKPHVVLDSRPFAAAVSELVVQSMSWPLYLSLEFKETAQYASGRRRKHSRHHACVLSRGKFFDPGEFSELDPEAIGHLSDRGVDLKAYIIVE